ncbi:MAG: CrcB family protein [Elusimicrobia bacterium]|nr:CrcB family protein [Elusimicrobiota bacterium]
MTRWLLLSGGSVAGGMLRFAVAGRLQDRAGAGFPYGVLGVNASACLIAGLVTAMSQDRLKIGPEARLVLLTGFCGAYSTFSTLIVDTAGFIHTGAWRLAGANIVASLVLGLAAFRIGEVLGRVF